MLIKIHKYIHTYTPAYILMNIRMAKAYRTTSSEALCIVTGMTPIIIKTEEAVKRHNIRERKGNQTQLIDREVELKNWPQPADVVKIIEDNGYKEQAIQIYTDGSKNEYGSDLEWQYSLERNLKHNSNLGWTTDVQTTKLNN